MNDSPTRWVLLAYRIPREPSTPRIAVWRKLEQLGVVRIGDGLVAIPADARTREQVQWTAQDIREAHGTASVWLAAPTESDGELALIETARTARVVEYEAVLAQARRASGTTGAERRRVLRRLREELRRINRRDFFPPPHRDLARAAVEALAEPTDTDTDVATGPARQAAR